MGMTTVLNAAGVNKERFVDYTDKNPATYKVRSQVIKRIPRNALLRTHDSFIKRAQK